MSSNPLKKTVARNSLVTVISKFTIKILSLGFTIWMVRMLGKTEFGYYALIWSYVTIFATGSDLGLGMYTIRELTKSDIDKQHLTENVIAFRLLLATLTFILIVITAQFTGYSWNITKHIFLAGSILLLYAIQDPLNSFIQAKERVDLSSLLTIVGQLTYVILGTLFLLLGWGITGLILAALANVGVSTALSWRLIQHYWGKLSWRLHPSLWPKLVAAAFPFGVIGFALNWSQKMDTIILALYWPVETVGWYNAAYNLILGMIIISNAINISLYPTMSKMAAKDYLRLHTPYKNILKYLFIISLPLACTFSILSRPIILTLYGSDFFPAILPFTILAWAVPIIFISEFLRYLCLIIGQERKAAIIIFWAICFNLGLNFLLIPTYGLLAAALTTVFTEIFLVGLYLWQLKSEIPLSIVGETFWKPALASLILFGILFTFSNLAPIFLLAVVLIAITIYLGTLIILGDIGSEEKMLLRAIFIRILPATIS